VWTATEAAASEVRLALAGATPSVVVFQDQPPEAEIVVAYDLPTSSRLASLAAAGPLLLLVPPLAMGYIEGLGLDTRPVQLPGVVEAARTGALERRKAVADVIASTTLDGAVLALAPLFDRFEPARVAAALYHLWTERPPAAAAPREASLAVPPLARMFVNAGRNDGITVADLVAVLTKEIGVDRTAIGRIELKDTHALVELPAQGIDSVIAAMDGKLLRRKRVSARLDRGRPARRR
jgi:ATP-dependent RNA helicase DeaD